MSFSLAHLALSVDASETGRNRERRELAGKPRARKAWNTICVIEPTGKARAVQGRCQFGVVK